MPTARPTGSDAIRRCHRIAAGAASYAAEHADVELIDLPYRISAGPTFADGPCGFDGAVIFSTSTDDEWVRQLLDRRVPLVSANGFWPAEQIPRLGFDYRANVDAAVRHFQSLHAVQAAFIAWVIGDSPIKMGYRDGFLSRCRDEGMQTAAHEMGEFPGRGDPTVPVPAAVCERLSAFLQALRRPAAAWCDDDMLARAVCNVALSAGMKIPAELAVLGTGDLRIATTGRPLLSTIAMPGELIGRRAVAMADKLIRGERLDNRQVLLPPPPIINRESTVGPTGDSVVRQALDWIRQHACEGATVNELMRAMPVSQRTLTSRFLAQVGRTPGEELRRVRAQHAMQLLRATDLTIVRITQLCGFDQTANFCNFFRRETGMMPSAHRLQWQKNRG